LNFAHVWSRAWAGSSIAELHIYPTELGLGFY